MKNNSYSFYCKYANSLFYKLKKYRSSIKNFLIYLYLLLLLFQYLLVYIRKFWIGIQSIITVFLVNNTYNSLNVYYYKHIKIHVSYVINSFWGNSDQRGRRYLCKYSRRHKPKLIT